MTDKELRHLKRAELLEMLIDQMKENDRLRRNLEKAQGALADRRIILDEAGSIADAAIQMNGVLEAAQAAAEQYLENIQRLDEEQKAAGRQIEDDARKRAETVRAEADAYSREVRAKADDYWRQVTGKIRDLLQDRESLEELDLKSRKGDPA